MIVTFPKDVLERLQEIEEKEGIAREDLVREAVAIWTFMPREERFRVGLEAIRNALRRLRGFGEDA